MGQVTIQQIRDLVWAGNAADDREKFELVDAFISNENNPMEQRLEVRNLCCVNGMGEDAITMEMFLEEQKALTQE